MKGPVIVDAGPLVALLNRREQHHDWAREQFQLISPPTYTCESVISEAAFLLRNIDGGLSALMQLLERGAVALHFDLAAELSPVTRLLNRYASIPMSVADACLVRMAEQLTGSTVLTLDADFRIYRKNGRIVIPTLMPRQ
jgi:predicted nucleic acid-binding protein